MAKHVMQFRYYEDNHTNNQPVELNAGQLVNGTVFAKYLPFTQLGIQALPGTRFYLNDNIDFWSGTKVYPQAIVVIDINKLKLLNDRKGHEAGDNQIKAVANVLIKTQRDNSEIMRTDGDEFMIYLVGYDEKKIGTYIHKLNRELISSLPNKDYGVSIGYSMIMNEQTTIDDAINDALLMINKSKESIK